MLVSIPTRSDMSFGRSRTYKHDIIAIPNVLLGIDGQWHNRCSLVSSSSPTSLARVESFGSSVVRALDLGPEDVGFDSFKARQVPRINNNSTFPLGRNPQSY